MSFIIFHVFSFLASIYDAVFLRQRLTKKKDEEEDESQQILIFFLHLFSAHNSSVCQSHYLFFKESSSAEKKKICFNKLFYVFRRWFFFQAPKTWKLERKASKIPCRICNKFFWVEKHRKKKDRKCHLYPLLFRKENFYEHSRSDW